MSGVGENRVRDRHERIVEAGGSCDVDVAVRSWVGPCRGHAYDTGHENADARWNAQPGEGVERPREGQNEGGNGEDSSIKHQAELVFREHAQSDLAGEQLRSRCEDGENDGSSCEDLSQDWTSHDQACITHVVDLGMTEFEIDQNQGRV